MNYGFRMPKKIGLKVEKYYHNKYLFYLYSPKLEKRCFGYGICQRYLFCLKLTT